MRTTIVAVLALTAMSPSWPQQRIHAGRHSTPPLLAAPQPPREVIFIFNWGDRHWTTGDVVPLNYVSAILFLTEPCALEFVGSERMHRAWHFHDVGCWEPTANDGYDFASSLTGDIRNYPGPMEYFVHGRVQSDGSVLLTEAAFDSLTFDQLAARRVEEAQLRKLQQMRDAQP